MTERVDRLEEIELSVHHIVQEDPIMAMTEYEIHAGTADVVEIPKPLAATVKTVTGVDIESEEIHCGAEIRVVANE